jgi:hypothetical protein
MKGNALVLGAVAGEVGPFGPYGGEADGDVVDDLDQAHAEPDEGRTDR